MTFASPHVETGVLDIKIQAASVDTGSGMKNSKLKGRDFFDAELSPLITFRSTKVVQTGPATFEVDGDMFTLWFRAEFDFEALHGALVETD